MNRELFQLDKLKINKEDRRFLLSKSATEIIFNEQGVMHNQMLLVSIFALLTSTLGVVISSSFVLASQKYFVIIFLFLTILLLIYLYLRSSLLIKKQNEQMLKDYTDLFKFHFRYSKIEENKQTSKKKGDKE